MPTEAGHVRRSLLRQALTARKGGKIGTGGRGAIALRFDDNAKDFRDKVLPLLVERQLPFTRVTTTKRVGTIGNEMDTWANIQNYTIKHGGEVWNHGATHRDATGEEAIHTEIVGALHDMRAKMPRIPIDCFAPPGGASISYDGHMPSNTVDNWADTYAGRLIYGHHALVSGYFENSFYRPMDGVLRDGQTHYSVDLYDAGRAKDLIDRARDWKMGVVMMWHAKNFGADKFMSTADFVATLDYLVAQREAGNLLVLTKSGLGVADVTSSARDDILPQPSGDPYRVKIDYPQYRQNVPGSTRELTATVTGPAGSTVTSRIGESSATHVIPATGMLALRHVATIPLDVRALIVSIDAPTTNARLYAI